MSCILDKLEFGICVINETVKGYNNRNAKLLHILDVGFEVGDALFQRLDILEFQLVLRCASVKLKGTDGCNYDNCVRMETGVTRNYVHKFFSAQVGGKSGFCNHVI